MVKGGEKTRSSTNSGVNKATSTQQHKVVREDHVIHERKLRYYKKTIQLLTITVEVFFLFFVAAVIFLFVAGGNISTLKQEQVNLIGQQNILNNQLFNSQEKATVVFASLPFTQLYDDNLVATFALPNASPTNITVLLSDVISQAQLGYQRRELIDEVSIPMHYKYAQTCFDFALFCANDPNDIAELKDYYADELTSLKLKGPQYLLLPLGATTKSVMDFRDFLTPVGFEEELQSWFVSRKSDEEFLEELWYVVSQLTTYSVDIEETPLYPLETLLLGGGDCEDSVILFTSMLRAANTGWNISFVYTDTQNPQKPLKYNHILVHVDTGSEEFFIETTSKVEMNPYDEINGYFLAV